jgi:hypothetical protein
VSELSKYDNDQLASMVYHLRKTGLSFVDIRHKLLDDQGTSPGVVDLATLYRGYLMRSAKLFGPDERQIVLGMELDRLDSLQSAVWAQAQAGDLKSIEIVLKIMGHRSKLTGLDQLDTRNQQIMQTVLIVGDDKVKFLEALESGRAQIMTSPGQDDDDDREVQ